MSATDAVSGILDARARLHDGLAPVVVVSLVLHVGLFAAVLLIPMGDSAADMPRTVMTISLGGSSGPRTGGMTPMGGRAVQAVAPEGPKPRSVAPPAASKPEMTLPAKATRPPSQASSKASTDAVGRRLAEGDEVREGSARAPTRARRQGFGRTGGGG